MIVRPFIFHVSRLYHPSASHSTDISESERAYQLLLSANFLNHYHILVPEGEINSKSSGLTLHCLCLLFHSVHFQAFQKLSQVILSCWLQICLHANRLPYFADPSLEIPASTIPRITFTAGSCLWCSAFLTASWVGVSFLIISLLSN